MTGRQGVRRRGKGEMPKILVAGDVGGNLEELYKRVSTVNAKSGPFDCLLCAGEFFGSADVGGIRAPPVRRLEIPRVRPRARVAPSRCSRAWCALSCSPSARCAARAARPASGPGGATKFMRGQGHVVPAVARFLCEDAFRPSADCCVSQSILTPVHRSLGLRIGLPFYAT